MSNLDELFRRAAATEFAAVNGNLRGKAVLFFLSTARVFIPLDELIAEALKRGTHAILQSTRDQESVIWFVPAGSAWRYHNDAQAINLTPDIQITFARIQEDIRQPAEF